MSKGKAPAFQLYAGDLLTDVMDWTDEEVGVHIRLMCWSWVNRRGIPRDTRRLTRIASGVERCWATIGCKWTEGPDDTWVNERLERTRSDSDAFRAKQKEKSLLAVAKRASSAPKRGKPTEQPTGSPTGDPLEGEVEVYTQSKKERAHEAEVMPAGMSVSLFQAVKRWEKYRTEKRHKLTPSTRDAFIKKVMSMGDDRAIAAIDHSIEQGWTGMYEPKKSETKKQSTDEYAASAMEAAKQYWVRKQAAKPAG